jgi:glycosyltransferase involved in cell wall biosynthesis
MASGKAVVATRVGGVPDVVQDGVTGYTVPVGDLHSFSEKVELLLGDPILRERMGETGRQWVSEHFSKQKLLRNIRGLYEELLSQKRKG